MRMIYGVASPTNNIMPRLWATESSEGALGDMTTEGGEGVLMPIKWGLPLVDGLVPVKPGLTIPVEIVGLAAATEPQAGFRR